MTKNQNVTYSCGPIGLGILISVVCIIITMLFLAPYKYAASFEADADSYKAIKMWSAESQTVQAESALRLLNDNKITVGEFHEIQRIHDEEQRAELLKDNEYYRDQYRLELLRQFRNK